MGTSESTSIASNPESFRGWPLKEIVVGRRCCAAPILGQSGSSAPPCWTGRAEHRAGERDRPGRRWQRLVANRFSLQRSAGRRPLRAGRTRSPFHPRTGKTPSRHLSHLGNGERNSTEGEGPRGRASGRERVQIRQQLQELRDRNLLLHIGRNRWRLP